ncbi:hypothetical protein SKAU_G00302430 [Synaphobranchus kaupii]|uniref:GP-PDE domain-containing protein n=1 Tax=Synaphobranchus kaupii TaxID=118154 RepID=A0A9Q1EVW9_SYNKA|nr:hypothetical protein SKAU_G00302430 [Synaphobranchus kaupii]
MAFTGGERHPFALGTSGGQWVGAGQQAGVAVLSTRQMNAPAGSLLLSPPRLQAEDLWRRAGAQWEKENEEDLKDKLDFLLTPPALYPPGVERPGLGCRELVARNLSKVLPAVSGDLGDWLAGTRAKTAQLLSVLLLHAEDHSTQHLQPLLAAMYRACADAEPAVVKSCLESAELLGRFVNPQVSLKLLLAHVENASSSSSSSSAPLMVLAAVLRGSSRDALRPHLPRLGDVLANPDIWQESQQSYLEQVLGCVQALLTVCEGDCEVISLQLLQVLLTVRSLSTEPEFWSKVEETTRALCSVLGLDGGAELYRRHMPQLIGWLSQTQRTWTNYSTQRLQLEVIAFQSGPVIGEFLPLLMPLLQASVQPSRDPEMRLQLFTLLSKLLLDAPNTLDSQGKFCDHLEVFLKELLLPNLEWQAGRTAAAIRTTALTCLYALLQGGAIAAQQLLGVQAQLTPRVLAALDEDSQTSRLLACRSLLTLLRLIGPDLHPDSLNTIYPELLKRADDSSKEVRMAALCALRCWFSCVGESYDRHTYCSHLQLLFQQLLLHMDDPESSVQDHVLDVLKAGSSVYPELLRQEVEAARDKQRNPFHCDQLLQVRDTTLRKTPCQRFRRPAGMGRRAWSWTWSLQLTGVPVLMHDDTVDRTTNGSGLVGKMRFIELRKLDASVKHRLRDKFPGQKVPTLQEAVEECIKHQLTIFFDVKGHPDEAAAALKVMYKKHPILYNTSMVCSFEPKVIYKMRQADADVATALTHRPWSLSRLGDGTPRFESPWKHQWMQALDVLLDWAHHHLLWNLCGVSAFLLQKSFISLDYVQYWSQRGVSVVGWTINTAVEKQYYQDLLKISYITDSLREDCDPHY